MKLLTTSNHKTQKSEDYGYLTAIMHLAPAKLSGHNVCTSASKGCIKACLNTAGRGKINSVQEARKNRTKLFFNDRDVFRNQLQSEIQTHIRKAKRLGFEPCIRLNGTSDIKWEEIYPEIFDLGIVVYDYTKHFSRMLEYCKGNLPDNYHLTFSRSENNDDKCLEILRTGRANITAVFGEKIPEKWKRFKTYNADTHDLRFLDPHTGKGGGMVGGLLAKGRAKKDTGGFVIY